MKNSIISILLLLSVTMQSQIVKPVKWTSKVEKVSDSEYNLIMQGKIEDGWHLYSQFTPPGGPLSAEFNFENPSNDFQLIGKVKESPYKKEYNDVFGVNEYFFEKKVTFTQKIKVLNTKLNKVIAKIDYQVCKQACINDKYTFEFTLPNSIASKEAKVDTSVVATIEKDTNVSKVAPKIDVQKDKTEPQKEEKKSLWAIFFLAFLGGFAALLTPCVFPMIPMTVSFFTKQSKNPAQGKRNAILYGLSIIVIYVVLGLAITAIFGADALNALSTNPWFNIFFFILLVVFAISFLGAFEIVLPNTWANKVDRQADRGGVIGILFMALALAIVSFSCTGPIVGTLLVQSASEGGIAPIVGMLGFSSALALPFMLFAMFPSWLHSLPKSGGWLNTVKVSLGFLELALAFKFLSNADMVLKLHYLEREVFLAIWIAIFAIWTLYLLGKITTPHDSPITNISVGRLSLAIIVFAFTIYLIPGIFGAPLKLISAFPPPQSYSESPMGLSSSTTSNSKDELPDGAIIGEHGIVTFNDYEKGLAYAKKVNKPVMLDFTGHACVNCRKMEINVWSDERILPLLKNEVVLISLYVDEDIDLPKDQQFVSKTTGSKIVTVGDKWTDFIISKYKTNTQPFYVLTDLKEQNLNTPISYTPNIEDYEKWLKEGISQFKK